MRLRIDSALGDDGVLRSTWLDGGGAEVVLDDEADAAGARALPADVVEVVVRRYGRPLEPAVAAELASEAGLDVTLSSGAASLLCFGWRGAVDVEPNDYLVLARAGAEPLAMPAKLAAAALRQLAAAFSRTT